MPIDPSEAARAMRAINSEKQQQAARENGKKGGRPEIPLDQIPCTCGSTNGIHKFTCKRRMTQYQRERRKKLSK